MNSGGRGLLSGFACARSVALALSVALWLAPGLASAGPGDVWTIAGGGPDDAIPATSVNLRGPRGVAADAAGNLFIADTANDLIRVLDAAGNVKKVAAGSLSNPDGIVVDSTGYLYIADTGNNRIRKVDPMGTITTIAGTGEPGFGGDEGAATEARLNKPTDVLLDAAGNVFVADTANNRIRRIDTAGVITTIAGTGEAGVSGDAGPAKAAQLSGPRGITFDQAGNLFVADTGNSRIRKIDTAGAITTATGDVPGCYAWTGNTGDPAGAAVSGLCYPSDILVDFGGNLYITDTGNHRVRKVDTFGAATTFAGLSVPGYAGDGTAALLAMFDSPAGLALDAGGNFYVADSGNGRIRKIDGTGIVTTAAGGTDAIGDGGAATAAVFGEPGAVAVDATGAVFVADAATNRVRKVDATGIISTIAGDGQCRFTGDGGPATVASLCGPNGLAVDASGNLYVADTKNNRVRKIDITGTIRTVAGHGCCPLIANPFPLGDNGPALAATLSEPTGLAIDAAENLHIADTGNHRVRMVDASGNINTVAGNGSGEYSGDDGPATAAGVGSPRGLAIDSTGNIYIAELGNKRIRRVSPTGSITTIAGTGECAFSGDGGEAKKANLCGPLGVAVDAAGNVFVADTDNSRVRLIDIDGFITTIAGTGTRDALGDAGPAAEASMAPAAIALTPTGNLTVADAAHRRVRVIESPLLAPARPVPNFEATAGDRSVSLSWDVPSGFAYAGSMVRMSQGAPPANPGQGSLVYQGRATSFTVIELSNCVAYGFAIFAYNRAGDFSEATAALAQPIPPAPAPTTMLTTISSTLVTYGSSVSIIGRLVKQGTTEGIAGMIALVQVRRTGTTAFQTIASPTTNPTGSVSATHKPLWNAQYLVRWDGTPCLAPSSSSRATAVRPKLTAGMKPTIITLGQASRVSGLVTPAHASQAIWLQQYVSGRWRTILTVKLSSTGAYVFTIKPRTRGKFPYRVYKPADADHAVASSGTLVLTVR